MANDLRKGFQTGQQLVAKAVERAATRREERTALKEAIDSGDWVTRDEILQERAGKKITKLLQWGLVLTLILLFVNMWYALLSVALIALRIYFIAGKTPFARLRPSIGVGAFVFTAFP